MGDPVTELLNRSIGMDTQHYLLAEIAVQLKRIADRQNIMLDTTVYPWAYPNIKNISGGIVECGQITTTCLNNT